MNKDEFKGIIKEAILELMATDEGKEAFGSLMMDAVGQWLRSYELDLERTHPDGTVERVKEKGDILAFIAQWISRSEGAIRGCQADAAAARNKSTQTRDIIYQLAERAEQRRLLKE